MKIIYKALIAAVLLFTVGSCKKLDSLLQDPSQGVPTAGNVDLYLNQVQLAFTSYYNNLSEYGEELTRMEYMAAKTYLDLYSPETFDAEWNLAYTRIIKNADAMITITKQTNKPLHSGIGKVLKAYTLATLVDYFGDVPFSEANAGTGNLTPKNDPGRNVYNGALALLDEAIADFGKVTSTTAIPSNDLFYAGTATASATRWRTLAKTLKLKLYNQTRLVDNTVKAKIDALLTENDLIDTDAEAFAFKYSTKELNPGSRHPKYTTYYTSSGAQDYIGNQYMNWVFIEKGLGLDPRWRFYFYRQIGNVTILPVSTLGCLVSPPPAHYGPTDIYCYADFRGFYGRDHGDDQGIPPDGQQRAVWGLYPAGGQFDNSEATKVDGNSGAKGQGIHPIWMPFFTQFVKAEAALKLGTAGTPKTLLTDGIKSSINYVTKVFPASISVTIPANRIPTSTAIDDYVNYVTAKYDAATSDDDRLNIVMKEYYLTLWGNGIESYNNYRRTGMPRGMQPNLNPTPGDYMRSMFYPAVFANRNQNVTQKDKTNVKVFWDNNPDNIYVK
jgi:Starch-binding associating with outer membrane/Susd and RagB outer membrane lipoprotein